MSTVLRRAAVVRQFFSPANPEHVRSLACFLETGSWGEVQFYHEAPFTDVPMTVLRKFAEHALREPAGLSSQASSRCVSTTQALKRTATEALLNFSR